MDLRTRGYLPHLTRPHSTYFVTFRLDDSLPVEALQKLRQEFKFRQSLAIGSNQNQYTLEDWYYAKVESYLDSNHGTCYLKNPAIASIVDKALRHFDGQRYLLHAWTVMPNHVHVLFTPVGLHDLSNILHSWKSFSANSANKLLGKTGRFWQPESYDRLIRSERQFHFTVRYILRNPVKAGLCREVHEWPWSGCSQEVQGWAHRYFK